MRQVIGITLGKTSGHTFVYSRFSSYCILGMVRTEKPKELQMSAIKVRNAEFSAESYMTRPLYFYLQGIDDDASLRALAYLKRNDPGFLADLVTRVGDAEESPHE